MGVLFHLVFASWDLGGMPKKTRKAESSTRSAGKKEREGQICGGFATQIPSENHMITEDVRVKIPTARSKTKIPESG